MWQWRTAMGCVCVCEGLQQRSGRERTRRLVIKPESDCEPGYNPVGSEETDSQILDGVRQSKRSGRCLGWWIGQPNRSDDAVVPLSTERRM